MKFQFSVVNFITGILLMLVVSKIFEIIGLDILGFVLVFFIPMAMRHFGYPILDVKEGEK